MGKVLEFLGLSVGVAASDGLQQDFIEAYRKDVTYVTGQALAFSYLKDNSSSVRQVEQLVRSEPMALCLECCLYVQTYVACQIDHALLSVS
jgi:preprotein translocase subunit SecA